MTIQGDLEHATGAAVGRINALEQELAAAKAEIARLTPSTARFAGDPGPGKLLWGCASPNNVEPLAHEAAIGHPLAIRRTFFSTLADIEPTGRLVATVKRDHAIGRLPWVSFKLPWKEVADGGHDIRLAFLFSALKATGKPVWLIVNHEPENDGGDPGLFRVAQRRIRERLTVSGATNVSFGGCLMSWTFNPTSGRDPYDWYPGVQTWDWLGSDHYTEVKESIVRPEAWVNFIYFCRTVALPPAVPEWGVRPEDPQGSFKIATFHRKMVEVGVVAASYFDTPQNSTGTGWVLAGAARDVFRNHA